MSDSSPRGASGRKPNETARRRSSARLAAVQALYQIELTGATPDGILRDMLDNAIGNQAIQSVGEDEYDESEIVVPLVSPDSELLTGTVRGVMARGEELDGMISAALSQDWTIDRLEAVLRAILRAGAFELAMRRDVPVKVTISEYVDVAHAFYSGPEPGLINAVLDRIARVVRAEDIR